jgi:hypothetical protein
VSGLGSEELLGKKSSGSSLEIREYGCWDLSRWPHGTLYPQKLALTSPTRGGRSGSIVRSWTQVTEFSFIHLMSFTFTDSGSSVFLISSQSAVYQGE